jgi:hypothetical protein
VCIALFEIINVTLWFVTCFYVLEIKEIEAVNLMSIGKRIPSVGFQWPCPMYQQRPMVVAVAAEFSTGHFLGWSKAIYTGLHGQSLHFPCIRSACLKWALFAPHPSMVVDKRLY